MPKKKPADDKNMMSFDTTKGTVVTMDLSKGMTGWAIHKDGHLIGYDAAPIGGEKLWHTYDNMRVRTSTILKTATAMGKQFPSLLVVEDAIKQPGLAARIYEVLYLAVSEVVGRGAWAAEHGRQGVIPMAVVAPTQVKAAVLGKDNKRGTTKGDVVKAVAMLYPIGLDPLRAHPDSDIADAIGVYLAASALGQVGRLRVAP